MQGMKKSVSVTGIVVVYEDNGDGTNTPKSFPMSVDISWYSFCLN